MNSRRGWGIGGGGGEDECVLWRGRTAGVGWLENAYVQFIVAKCLQDSQPGSVVCWCVAHCGSWDANAITVFTMLAG
jgi:hypothetical protein